jgi:hypothetical protein
VSASALQFFRLRSNAARLPGVCRLSLRRGQRTDIHVDATIQKDANGEYDSIYATVEVKGNWNAELRSAMETQLRDRYLKEKRCRNGLYLPVWFSSTKWSDTDPRKRQCARMSLNEAREFFARQAVELSAGGYYIRSYVLDASLS